jgi:DNA-binding NtrC family response regulator
VEFENRINIAGVIEDPPESMDNDRGAILVIEDCEPLLFYLNTALLTLGYEQQFLAANLAEAHSVWLQHKGQIGHIVLNYELPDGVSFKFARLALQECPGVNIIVTSGYDIEVVRESLGHTSQFQFLQKPFRLAELKNALEAGSPDRTHH